jgi:hypothetical protein
MSRQPKKKRQHYVPRLILRKFSKDDKRISLLVLQDGREVPEASLKEQCYEDYFYGKDGGIEDAFGTTEGRFSAIIGNLDPDHLERISKNEIDALRQFVHYQSMRTLASAEYTNAFSDALAKSIISKDSRFGDLDFSKIQINLKNPQHESLYHAAELTPLLLDLDVKFLTSEKKIGFVLGDDPATHYNQFAEHHPLFRHWSGTWGLALKGLQMFLPVSPRVCIAVYDPSTYMYGSPKKRVCAISMHDVRFLNTLQALTAHKCLYFDPGCTPKEELDRLKRERLRHGEWRKPLLFEGEPVRAADGSVRQFIEYNAPELRLGTQFNFSKIIDRNSYEGYDRGCIPVRSPELVDLMKRYSQFLKERVEEARAKAGSRVDENLAAAKQTDSSRDEE